MGIIIPVDDSTIDKIFALGWPAVVGLAAIYAIYRIAIAWIEYKKGSTVTAQLQEKHPGQSPEQLVDGYASLAQEFDRIHRRIDRVSESTIENRTNIKNVDKKLDKVDWP